MRTRYGRVLVGAFCAILLVLAAGRTSWSQPASADGKDGKSQLDQTVEKGLVFLRDNGQATDGTFTIQAGPGLTALALTAALRNGRPVDDPMVAKGLKAMEGFVKPDGGI